MNEEKFQLQEEKNIAFYIILQLFDKIPNDVMASKTLQAAKQQIYQTVGLSEQLQLPTQKLSTL